MAPIFVLRVLGVLPLTLAHMQMLIPSPIRDPHSDRLDEVKDYNILTPLHPDGSDFACKGYQHNTPWTTVATYEAGETYKMTLRGGATHGGGSCQLSISCDGGKRFKVIKSMIGNCPLQKQYDFTIPPELGRLNKKSSAQCLFAWTWFNKIGNREMYMNCAVVEIIPPKSGRKSPHRRPPNGITKRDTAVANAAAQSALISYPDLFVANLKDINDCVVPETVDVIFDDPGKATTYADGVNASTRPSFERGACTAFGRGSAGSSSTVSSGHSKYFGSPSDPATSDNDGKWQGQETSSQQGMSDHGSSSSEISDGMWHPDLWGEKSTSSNVANQQEEASIPKSKQTSPSKQENSEWKPVAADAQGNMSDRSIQKDLNACLARLQENTQAAMLLRRHIPVKHAASTSNTDSELFQLRRRSVLKANLENDGSQQSTVVDPDATFLAFLERLHDVKAAVFVLVKFASQYLDTPPPPSIVGESLDGTREDSWISASPAGSTTAADYNVAHVQNITLPRRAGTVSGGSKTNDFSGATLQHIVDTLADLESDIGQLLTYAKSRVASQNHSEDTSKLEDATKVNRIARKTTRIQRKRRMVIPGIFPASLQNLKERYFSNFGPWFPKVTIDNHGIHFNGDASNGSIPNVSLLINTTEVSKDAFTQPKPIIKRQDLSGEDDVADAASVLFPGMEADPVVDSLPNQDNAKKFDWSKVFPDSGDDAQLEAHNVSASQSEAIVGLPKFQNKTTSQPLSNVAQPTSENITDSNSTLGELIKAMFPGISDKGQEQSTVVSDETRLATQSIAQASASSESIAQDISESFQDWIDGVFPGQQADNEATRAASEPVADPTVQHDPVEEPSEDITKILPFFLGPGPVVPEGSAINWPGPFGLGSGKPASNLENMPKLVDNLGPGAESEVRKFFSNLKNEAASKTSPSSSKPTTSIKTNSPPALVNDSGPDSEADIRKFFDDLKKDIAGFAASASHTSMFPTPTETKVILPRATHTSPKPSTLRTLRSSRSFLKSTPTSSVPSTPSFTSCADARRTLTKQLTVLRVDLKKPCTGLPKGAKIAPKERARLEKALAATCTEDRKQIKISISKVAGVLQGGCDQILQFENGDGRKLDDRVDH